MQVGPLARMLVAYASGHREVRDMVTETLDQAEVGPEALFSTLGRTAARGMETVLLARRMEQWMGELTTRIKRWRHRNVHERQMGAVELARESRGLRIPGCTARLARPLGADRGREDHAVSMRRAVDLELLAARCTGSTGSVRSSARPTTIHWSDSDQPLEILRTIHSFDPCMACGVHVLDAEGREVVEVKVQ